MEPDVALHVDVVSEAETWTALPDCEALATSAIAAAAEAARFDAAAEAEVSVLFCDDNRIRELNRLWRNIDKPTNVLSFPAHQPAMENAPALLGDIAVAYETVRREADDEGKSLAAHTTHMVVHGFLHLLGYDHEEDSEAQTMEDMERVALRNLGIDDPYRDGDAAGPH
jgi:probable rRNA maturation factor